MSTNEVLSFYTGEGKFKDSDFQKRQEMYKEQSKLKGGLSVKEQYERLSGEDELSNEEKIGRFTSANKMDELNLTEDIKLEEVFLVTRELQDGNDSYEVYEVYDKDGNILLKTDKDRNIITEEALKDQYSPELIQQLEEKVLMRIMRRDPKTGEMKDCVGVSDKLDPDKVVDEMGENRDTTVYSEIKDADEKDDLSADEELAEEQIEEKTGGHIVDIIEDPNFYQIIPFAKYRTYLVEEGGQYKFVDGQGEEIKGMQEESRQVFVDNEQTQNIEEKQMSDMVFSTGRNDDGIVIAITPNGKMHVVDANGNSEQLDTAGYNVTEKEQLETRENITERDDLTDTDVTMDFLNDLVNKEDIELSEKDIRTLYETCQNKHLMKSDIQLIRDEAIQIERGERERGDRDIGQEYEDRMNEQALRNRMYNPN